MRADRELGRAAQHRLQSRGRARRLPRRDPDEQDRQPDRKRAHRYGVIVQGKAQVQRGDPLAVLRFEPPV